MADSKHTKEQDGTTAHVHRPRHTAVDDQRSHIEQLMRSVDKHIDLPTSKKPTVKPPPDLVLNIRGSSAGAGSSDFHTYRELRRKENLRVKLIEEEAAEDQAKEQFEKEVGSLKRKDEEKTAKNRAKRQRRKQSSREKKQQKAA